MVAFLAGVVVGAVVLAVAAFLAALRFLERAFWR